MNTMMILIMGTDFPMIGIIMMRKIQRIKLLFPDVISSLIVYIVKD